ncbi:MAG: hypothetical protein FJX72_16695 [Armatimonadetes bacterium]|nr:hypothetical protein [Armatimonadota bacterium]
MDVLQAMCSPEAIRQQVELIIPLAVCGFLGGLLKGVVKGVTGLAGLATGGVGSTILGIAGDVLSGAGGGGKQKTSSSTGTSGTTTQQTMLRDWTATEQGLYDQAAAGLAAAGQPMTPEAAAAIRERIYQANFLPQRQAIEEGLATAGANRYSQAARRGAGQSSATVAGSATDEARAARELGLASQNATIAAENQVLAQQQAAIAASQSYVQTMNALWDQRLKGSKIVQSSTSSGHSSSETRQPGGGLLGGIGAALGNKDSWLNKNVLGSGKKSKPKFSTTTH